MSTLGRRTFLRLATGGAAFTLIRPGNPRYLKRSSPQGTSLVEDDIYLKHDTGEFAWENIRRLKALDDGLKDANLLDSLSSPRPSESRAGMGGVGPSERIR